MQRKVGALDDIDGADERVDDERCAGRVIEREGVCLAVDADGGVFAARDEDRVVDLGVDLDGFGGGVEVVLFTILACPLTICFLLTYYYPLVAVQLLLRRLLGPHSLWLLRLGRRRALTPAQAAGTVTACWGWCTRTQRRILMRHLAWVDLF